MNHPSVASRPAFCAMGICLVVAGAWAQSAQPTAPARPVVQGRALDADLRLPTMAGPGVGQPLNTGVPLNTGNPLITGNVRFGRGFQGRVGYSNPFAFRRTLQSSTLNDFRGRSLTYADLLAGTVPMRSAVPYYPTNSTILSFREASAGRARPGTNQPVGTGQEPLSASVPLDPRIGHGARVRAEAAAQGAAPLDASLYYQEGVRPGFGLPTRSALSLLDTSVRPSLPTAESEQRGRGYVLPRDPRLGGDPIRPLEPADLTARESQAQDARVQAPEAPVAPAAEPEAPEPKGEDVFEDLRAVMEGPRGPALPEQPDLWKPLTGRTAPLAPVPAPVAEPARPTKIDTLAGSKPTPLNVYLRGAERLMKEGEYERAAGKYRIASLLNSENPLPHLGWANALMGRRMFSSAAFHLRAAISRFPKLAAVEMDLPEFYPDRVAFSTILVDLLREVKKPREKPDAGLHLLMGYAFYFSRTEKDAVKRIDDAIRHMDTILKSHPDDKEARAFRTAFEAARKAAAAKAK